jgi:hypothetical protein
MARKGAKGEAKAAGSTGKALLAAVKAHQDALLAAGLQTAVLERYENALRGLAEGGRPNPAAQTLVKEVQKVAEEYQVAIRKEFPSNASFHAFFRAGEPMPQEAHAVLALGREVAKQAPDFMSNFIRHAINAATTKHLGYLCDQLEKELGGADPKRDAEEAEKVILEAARAAFEGKPELAAFAL